MHKQAKGSILLLLCAMIWGAAFVAQSESMQYIGPFTMGAARFFLAGLVLLPVIAVLDRKGWSQNRPVTGAEKKKQLLSGMICGVLLFAATTLQQFGLLDTTVGKSGFVTALYIVFVPILGALMGRSAGLGFHSAVLVAHCICGCLLRRRGVHVPDHRRTRCAARAGFPAHESGVRLRRPVRLAAARPDALRTGAFRLRGHVHGDHPLAAAGAAENGCITNCPLAGS